MKEELLVSYAQLIATSGANVQKGQYVLIYASVEQEHFASLVAKECYALGAKRVLVRWTSELKTRVDYECADVDELCTLLPQEEAEYKFMVDNLPVRILLEDEDPDALKGIDSSKFGKVMQSRILAMKPYREKIENRHQWVIAGVPSIKWAKKVFPDAKSDKQAVELLWKAIIKTARAERCKGINNWKKHDRNLKKRCKFLNSLKLANLHYTSKNGTDLTVGLIPGVIFLGGGEKTIDGIYFQPNIPSEEVFTSPMKGKAEGIVYASKPLVYQGHLIKDFYFKFHEGKVVEVKAKTGQEVLENILKIDDGASYLGECAFVPFDSPINNTNLLFYSTLYDENAACHLAIGKGFTNLYPKFEKYTEEQLHSFGINESGSHVDFMIGTEDLNVVGTTIDGKKVEIFKNGNWAF